VLLVVDEAIELTSVEDADDGFDGIMVDVAEGLSI